MGNHPRPVLDSCKAVVKAAVNAAALAVAAVPAATCWLEHRLTPGGEALFAFWAHLFALLPGHPGQFCRRAFYVLTLDSCSLQSSIGFGAFFSRRGARVEADVYIGPYAVIGNARIREGSLIGTRASLLSGSSQHQMDDQGRWTPSRPDHFTMIELGPHAWVGEAAIIMADVGEGSVVAAGAVVSAAVPPMVTVAGNPARFVRANRPSAQAPPAGAPAVEAAGVAP